jgi:hypothetical protein
LNSHAEGNHTSAQDDYSHAEGSYTTASGEASHAEGKSCVASGNYSHAEGSDTDASGNYSHAEGSDTDASGNYSHAEGMGTYASGASSHAEGNTTYAYGTSSHAEGELTEADEYCAHAEGFETYAYGKHSHSEGQSTTASGENSHAEGYSTTAGGNNSHAEGNSTTASGESSHAGGESSIAKGKKSFVHGYSLTAEGENQAVFGKYNFVNTTDIFQIGGGTSNTNRKNIFSIDTDGDAKIEKSLNIGGLPTDLMAGYSLGVNGYTYFNDFVSVSDNYTPTEDNHLVNRKFVTDNLPNITHIGITATEGQNIFDFSTVGLTDLSTYYLVFYDGLLLMEGMHYNITDKYKVSLLDWTAPAGHMIHVLGFKPIQAASMSYDALELINGSY